MRTLAQSAYANSRFGLDTELPGAGTQLENPYVYDASAKELKVLAERGLIEIIDEKTHVVANESLIRRLRFRRLR